MSEKKSIEEKADLKDLLDQSYTLLKNWEDSLSQKRVFLLLKSFLESLDEESPLFYAKGLGIKLTLKITKAQFKIFLIPFEREYSRLSHESSLKVEEGDKPKSEQKLPKLYFILDNLRSAHNVGSLIRLADCVGAEMILTGYTAKEDNPKVAKAAMGGESYVKVSHFEKAEDALLFLKAKGVSIFALETVSSAEDLFDFSPPGTGGSALLVGNERHGISYDLLNSCDAILRIPVWGIKNSLNVSSALSIAAYELRRKFLKK